MLSYLAYFSVQMLVHSRLFVLINLMSHIVYICTIILEQINDDYDDETTCMSTTAILFY